MLTQCWWVTIKKVTTQAIVFNLSSCSILHSYKKDWLRIHNFNSLFHLQIFLIKWDHWINLIFKNNNGNQLIDQNQLPIKQLNTLLSDRHQLIIDKNLLKRKVPIIELNRFSQEFNSLVEIIFKYYHRNLNPNSVNSFCWFQMKNKLLNNKDKF
jgi:hypothetical protein